MDVPLAGFGSEKLQWDFQCVKILDGFQGSQMLLIRILYNNNNNPKSHKHTTENLSPLFTVSFKIKLKRYCEDMDNFK